MCRRTHLLPAALATLILALWPGPASATWSATISDVMNLVYCLVGSGPCAGLQPGADAVDTNLDDSDDNPWAFEAGLTALYETARQAGAASVGDGGAVLGFDDGLQAGCTALGGAWDGANCAPLAGPNLTGADVSYSSLVNASLPGVSLAGATLNHTNLQSANLAGADLTGASLVGASLYMANLQGANLDGADLTDAALVVAVFTGASLVGANLTGVGLYHAELTDADLTGADLTGADAYHADILHADLTDVTWSNTRCPTGVYSDASGGTCCGQLFHSHAGDPPSVPVNTIGCPEAP